MGVVLSFQALFQLQAFGLFGALKRSGSHCLLRQGVGVQAGLMFELQSVAPVLHFPDAAQQQPADANGQPLANQRIQSSTCNARS